jgi:hypothetical protein
MNAISCPWLARLQIVQAPLIWLIALAGVWAGAEPFASWLYHFAWWPLLLFLDGLLMFKGEPSQIWTRPQEIMLLLGWSVTVWLIFEALNLTLLNWRYVGMEPRLWLRWVGYSLAFATVLPGIFLTARVIGVYGIFADVQGKPRTLGKWQPLFLMLGTACLVLPYIFPTYAFPLIWLAFIFLLDPFVELLGGEALIPRWAAGERRDIYALLAAGLLCGLWWEMWNYPARARWIYTLPILNFGKIFEMPFLGYLGFPVFALEAAVMYSFLVAMEERVITAACWRRRAWAVQVLFWLIMFFALDRITVLSFR